MRFLGGFVTCLGVLGSLVSGQDPVWVGEGAHRFRWTSFAEMPDGLGSTHGVVVIDKAGRVYVATETERALCVFEPDGSFIRSFGAEWKGGLHGMVIREEGGEEFLYLAHTGRQQFAKIRLDGEVVWSRGYPTEPGVYPEEGKYFRPTSIAVGPEGEIFVADGYGRGYIHVFDAERNWVRTFGGPGTEVGQFKTPHGLWIDTRKPDPRLMVADRENHRVQIFDLRGNPLGVIEGFRRPCNLHQWKDLLVVADLAGRVTLVGADDGILGHLGDQPDESLRAQFPVPRNRWEAGKFLAPHGACFDASGNIFVMDWNQLGRVTRLLRLPE